MDEIATTEGARPPRLWAGVVAFVLTGISAALTFNIPLPPPPPDLMDEMIRYFISNRGQILAASYLDFLGLAAFMVFVADLRLAMRSTGDARFSTMAFGAGIAAAAIAVVGIAMRATLAFSIAEGGQEFVMRAGYDFMNIALVGALIPTAVLIATVSFSPPRTRVVPGWVAAVGGFAALLCLVRPIGLFTTNASLMPGGPAGRGIYFVFSLWILMVSLTAGAHPKGV